MPGMRLQVLRIVTFYTFVFCVIIISLRAEDNCTCEYRPEVDLVGPFCSEWVVGKPPFCYLSGGDEGKFCPDAIKAESGDFYWTESKTICARSSGYVQRYCRC